MAVDIAAPLYKIAYTGFAVSKSATRLQVTSTFESVAVGVMDTVSPEISELVVAVASEIDDAVSSAVDWTFASARRLITSFVNTFQAAAVATSPAAGR